VKNAVLWDVIPRGYYKNRRFGGSFRFHYQGGKNQLARKNVNSNVPLKRPF
jgi:hypothetical protein